MTQENKDEMNKENITVQEEENITPIETKIKLWGGSGDSISSPILPPAPLVEPIEKSSESNEYITYPAVNITDFLDYRNMCFVGECNGANIKRTICTIHI